MPKIVDHEKQKELLAEATWRVIIRDGMEQATVRKVAEEAKMSVGSMRHYFSTQSELYTYSMNLVTERVKNRIQALQFNGPPLMDMKKILTEILPMDEERKIEMEVWLAFNTKALTDPSLRSLSQKVYMELKAAITKIVNSMFNLGFTHSKMNIELEIERLYALIDGLALHGIQEPTKMPPSLIEAVVMYHLESMCK
ncbi:TetR/AcrR family transcriptional regulator [Heyndrickxia sporothermodurans]